MYKHRAMKFVAEQTDKRPVSPAAKLYRRLKPASEDDPAPDATTQTSD